LKFILLFHGLSFTSQRWNIPYWGNIPDQLEEQGFTCFQVPTGAYDSPEQACKKAVAFIKSKKSVFLNYPIHLVGHSRGGIDAILTAQVLDKDLNISSISCISAPIQGALAAKKIVDKYTKTSFLYKLLNLMGKILGDKNPDAYEALRQLSLDWSDKISSTIKIFIYESKYPVHKMSWLWKRIASFLYGAEHAGDGMVNFSNLKLNQSNVEFFCMNSLSDKIIYHWSMLRWPTWLGGKRVDLASLLLSNLSKL